MTSALSSASNASASQSVNPGTGHASSFAGSFRDFEKKTCDVWDLDDEDDDLEKNLHFSFPISIAVEHDLSYFKYKILPNRN